MLQHTIPDDPLLAVEIFQEMKANVQKRDLATREQALKKLILAYESFIPRLDEAMKHDRGYNQFMSNFGAHAITLSEMRDSLANFRRWSKPKPIQTPIVVGVASCAVEQQPLGLVLVISAWNYPIYTAMPLVAAAISAGNSVILKPSELAPYTSKVLKELFDQHMDKKYYRVIEGQIEVAKALSKQPFNMICFTGSTTTGRMVAIEAAKNLTPCLLELGGKCPVIVDETANIDSAVLRIIFGKYLNCGQTCVGVDHVWVAEKVKEEFKKKLLTQMKIAFKGQDLIGGGNYGKINHLAHFHRLEKFLRNSGGNIIYGGQVSAEKLYMEPTIIEHPRSDSPLSNEQIFGPIMPIHTFSDLKQLVSYLNTKSKPLAVYMFSESRHNISYVKDNTSSGAFVSNDTVVQLLNPHLPFGGVGESGYGRYHGESGFLAFSNPKSICYTKALNSYPLSTRFSPYTPGNQRVMTFLLKIGGITYGRLRNIIGLVTLGAIGAVSYMKIAPRL